MSRFYHSTTLKYNIYFNGRESYKKGINKINDQNSDNYALILSVFTDSKEENASVANGEMEKAIQKSDIGINPTNDGKLIRLVFPELTEERRRELVKVIKKKGEESKVAIRSIRRDANETIKKQCKDSVITEDDQKKLEEKAQKLTDNTIKEIDHIASEKEKEIMEF